MEAFDDTAIFAMLSPILQAPIERVPTALPITARLALPTPMALALSRAGRGETLEELVDACSGRVAEAAVVRRAVFLGLSARVLTTVGWS
jgi:hypothetical protein